LFGDRAPPGDGRSRGDGPEFEDGVATWISLIGVLAEASKIYTIRRCQRSQCRRKSLILPMRRTKITRRYIQGETWSVALDLESRKRQTAAGILQFMNLEIHIRKF
jgi:hypothetical protein